MIAGKFSTSSTTEIASAFKKLARTPESRDWRDAAGLYETAVPPAFVGLNLFDTRAHLYRAILEGVTFALRHNMETGAKGSASLEPPLMVVGGPAKSSLWMEIVADVTSYLVWTIREDVEAAIGAARLATLGCDLVRQEDASWITLIERARPCWLAGRCLLFAGQLSTADRR